MIDAEIVDETTGEVTETHAVPYRPVESDRFMPVLSTELVMQRYDMLRGFVAKVLRPEADFGTIPGAGTKSVLLKPGAEKLCSFFGLTVTMRAETVVEDWTGKDHEGEPFFFYRYRCELSRDGALLASTVASCNSWETKYRYRDEKAKCPKCGAAAINRSKDRPEFYCWKKIGGCGATFSDTDKAITGQTTGRIPNPDIADIANTVDKMAQKRALVGSTLIATGASEFFTQDIEGTAAHAPDRAPVARETRPATNGHTPAPADPRPAHQRFDTPYEETAEATVEAIDEGDWQSFVLGFGKHKGQALIDIPSHYLDWLDTKWEPKPKQDGSLWPNDEALQAALAARRAALNGSHRAKASDIATEDVPSSIADTDDGMPF